MRSRLHGEIANMRELMDERDVRYQQRYDASQKALEAALLAADRAVQAALLAAKEAVTKAELSADKRFELLNELRTGVATADQLEALEKIVNALVSRVDRAEASLAGGNARLRGIYAAIGAAVAVVTIIAFVAKFLP
jgi:uncharacterized tellurite resistance protein B-like protein